MQQARTCCSSKHLLHTLLSSPIRLSRILSTCVIQRLRSACGTTVMADALSKAECCMRRGDRVARSGHAIAIALFLLLLRVLFGFDFILSIVFDHIPVLFLPKVVGIHSVVVFNERACGATNKRVDGRPWHRFCELPSKHLLRVIMLPVTLLSVQYTRHTCLPSLGNDSLVLRFINDIVHASLVLQQVAAFVLTLGFFNSAPRCSAAVRAGSTCSAYVCHISRGHAHILVQPISRPLRNFVQEMLRVYLRLQKRISAEPGRDDSPVQQHASRWDFEFEQPCVLKTKAQFEGTRPKLGQIWVRLVDVERTSCCGSMLACFLSFTQPTAEDALVPCMMSPSIAAASNPAREIAHEQRVPRRTRPIPPAAHRICQGE